MEDQSHPKPASLPTPRLLRLLRTVAFIAVVPSLLALGARYWWFLDLFTHFCVYYAGALLPLCVLFVIGRQWKRATICGLALRWNLLLIVPLYIPRETTAVVGAHVRCLTANVFSGNRKYERFLSFVRDEDPDVVVVIEVNDDWARALEPLKKDYPYFDARPRAGNFGIAIFSRLPATIEFREFGGSGVLSVVASLNVEDHAFTLIGTHTFPPMSSNSSAVRNEHLRDLARKVRDISGPVVVLGDLNITSWSPHFRDLIKDGGLIDSRTGFGVQPTWTGNHWFMRIPIDHVLVSPTIGVQSRHVGGDIGSDHRPVVADLSIPIDR